MKITHTWNSGNFTLAHSAEVNEKQLEMLASKGLLWFAQRNGKHDMVLGAFEEVNEKMKRKAGWKRGDVGYSEERAMRLRDAYGEFEIEKDVKLQVVTEVGEYTKEAAALVYRDARTRVEAHESAGDLEKWLKEKCGYGGNTHTDDGEDFSQAMLIAVDKAVKAFLKANSF